MLNIRLFNDKTRLLDKRITLAKSWLLHSGIQNIGGETPVRGGFNAWYDLDNNNYFYTYSEITGYAITTLLYLYWLKKEQILLDRAKLAADWLIEKALHNVRAVGGAVRTRYYYNQKKSDKNYSFEGNIVRSFDNGIVLNGLSNLYEFSSQENYYLISKKIADLILKMQKSSGLIYPEYNLKNKKLGESYEKWSTQPGSFHVKIIVGLINFCRYSNDKKYEQAAKKLCNKILEFQKEDGRFITFKEDNTHLHPHCYSAEGLLLAGLYFREEKYIRAALRATKWLLNNQMENGGLPSLYVKGRFIKFERADILAQTLRLATLFLNMNLLEKSYKKNVEKLVDRLISFQYTKEGSQKGGFFYGYDVDYKTLKEKKTNHLNSWCTMFALQALIMYKQYLKNRLSFNIKLFI
jgi:uncharacterized protein YyaL (SSP411 family)